MANYSKIEIEFTTNTLSVGDMVAFKLRTTPTGSTPVQNDFVKTAIPTANGNPNFFAIPTSFTSIVGEAIATSYYSVLIANLGAFPFIVSKDENIVTIKVFNTEFFTYEFLTHSYNVSDVVITILNDQDEVIPYETIEPVTINDISIEIIDTYSNVRVLVEEYASINACKIQWDGGDTIYKSIKNSKLSFDFLVNDQSDAKFYHLFTGDEKRYLVKLFTVDESLVKTLLWKGFLLPDEYKEPYKTGVYFVDFTAVDMLGTLKGVYFEDYIYSNEIPLFELLSMILKNTGLEQDILYFPSLIPLNFSDLELITIPLYDYFEKGKKQDIYKIFNDFLVSFGCEVYNYNGYWIIEGIAQKHLSQLEGIKLDNDGVFVSNVYLNKREVELMYSDLMINAVPPFKKVNIVFPLDGKDNLYADNVVEVPYTYRLKNNASGLKFNNLFSKKIDYFTTTAYVYPSSEDENRFGRWSCGQFITSPESTLNNYLQFERIYVTAGVLYLLEWNIEAKRDAFIAELFTDFKNGVPYIIRLNGNIVASNHILFSGNDVWDYTKIDNQVGFLKKEIRFSESGWVDFQVTVPITNNYFLFLDPLMLKLSVVDKEIEDVVAVRSINFTEEMEFESAFLASSNASLKNSICIKRRNSTPSIVSVDFTQNQQQLDCVRFDDTGATDNSIVALDVFDINATLYNILFVEDKKNNLFVVNNDIVSRIYCYGNRVVNDYKLGYYVSKTNFPVLPSDYKPHAVLATGDELFLCNYEYFQEDILRRDQWRVYGSSEVDSFLKSLSKVYHYTRPQTLYSTEGLAFSLVFPTDLVLFYYADEEKLFIPTRLELDLFAGKTSIKTTEAQFQILTDISYE